MKLPDFILIWLPEKLKKKYILHLWNTKTDEQILNAYNDRTQWISGLEFLGQRVGKSKITSEIILDCLEALNTYILPQMKKRGIPTKFTGEIHENKTNYSDSDKAFTNSALRKLSNRSSRNNGIRKER